jgi:hypothetical protein
LRGLFFIRSDFFNDIALQFSQFVLHENAVNFCSLPALIVGFILAADAIFYWGCRENSVVVFYCFITVRRFVESVV